MAGAGNAGDQAAVLERHLSWKRTGHFGKGEVAKSILIEIKKEPAETMGHPEKRMVSLSMCVCAKSLRSCPAL